MKKVIFILLLCAVILGVPVARAEAPLDGLDTESLQDSLPDTAGDLLDGLEPTSLTPEQMARRLLNELGQQSGGALKEAVGSLILLLSVILVCGLFGAVSEGVKAGGEALHIAAAVAVTTISMGGLTGLMSRCSQAIFDISLYSKTLIPVMAALQTAMGQPGTAAARHGATMLFGTLLTELIGRVLFPMVYVYILLLTVDAVLPRGTLARLAKFIRVGTVTVLSVCLTLFITWFSLSGAIAGSADAVAVKSARAGIGAAVPVVGTILSDAAEAILLGGGVLKGAIGLYGILALAAICLEPLLGLAVRWMLFKLGAALAGPVADERIVKLLDGLSDAFGMVLGMTASCAVLLCISIISMMASGGLT